MQNSNLNWQMPSEFLNNTKPVVKWKTFDYQEFSSAVDSICYQMLVMLEQRINDLYANTKTTTLKQCFMLLSDYFSSPQCREFFNSPKVTELLEQEQAIQTDTDTSVLQQERIDFWIKSCIAHVDSILDELAEYELNDITTDTGIVISHWQCSEKPCYRIYRIHLVSEKSPKSNYMRHQFSAGGAPSPGGWPGYYSSSVGLADLGRYWNRTLEITGKNCIQPETEAY